MPQSIEQLAARRRELQSQLVDEPENGEARVELAAVKTAILRLSDPADTRSYA